MFHQNCPRRLDYQNSDYSIKGQSRIARQGAEILDAQTAATVAFDRAQKRSIYGNDIISSFTNSHYSDDVTHRRTKNEHEIIRRHQSVRFVGPNSTQKQLFTRKNEYKINTSKHKSSETFDKISIPETHSSPDFSLSIQRKTDCLVDSRGSITIFTDNDSKSQKYNPKENYDPLSYPLDASNFYNPGNSQEKCSFESHHQFPRENLVANNSPSFLREKREQNEENDSAVNIARDRFLHEAVQQRLREKPSFFHRSRTPRQEQVSQNWARKTTGRSSQLSPSLPNQIQISRNPSFKGTARKATKSVKSTIQKALGLSKDDTILVPSQQVEARNVYACQYDSKLYHESKSSIEIYNSDRASIANVASHMPSIYDVASGNQLRSHAGSIKSSKTDNSVDKSRVTSWNSTAVDSVVSQRKSPSPQKIDTCLSTMGEKDVRFSFQSDQAEPSDRSLQDRNYFTTSATISSARIYSALMKRIKPNYPRAKTDKLRGTYFKQSNQRYDRKMGEPTDYTEKNFLLPTIKRGFSGKSVDTACRINIDKKSHNLWEDENQIASFDKADLSHKMDNPCLSFQDSKMPQAKMQATHEQSHSKKKNKDETWPLEMATMFPTASYTRLCGEDIEGNAYGPLVKKITQKPTLGEVRVNLGEKHQQECESTYSGKGSPKKLSALELPIYYPPQSPQSSGLYISNYEGSTNSENVRLPENSYTESMYSSSPSMSSRSLEKVEERKIYRSDTPSYNFPTTGQSNYYTRNFENCLNEDSSSDNIINSVIEVPTRISGIQYSNEVINSSLDDDTAIPMTPDSFDMGHVREHTRVFDAEDGEDFQYKSKKIVCATSLNQQKSATIANKTNVKEKTMSKDVNHPVNPTNFSSENLGDFSIKLTSTTPPVPFRSLLRTVQSQDSAKINFSENASYIKPDTSLLQNQEPLRSLGNHFGKLCAKRYENSIESDQNLARSQSVSKSDGLLSTHSLTHEEPLTYFGNNNSNPKHSASELRNNWDVKQLKVLNPAVEGVNNFNMKIDENVKVIESSEDYCEKEYTSETEELSDCFL
ncbi:hypothetical protein BGHDH14_bgh05707 [Blumeria hordei DH14]|uniref:Uncharacterized protein n=1 Tax=Blumeria graminis f. sp. hordei (strain DH14) TaxID=546991 RepID=N1JQ71_BLUG1|nr:hypothetical protein BGHDH14_bgh05707 [Blumeria hordei DH14]